ncbi:hypothetical protein KC19_7G091100 [Ceratodon purpureus]|uniref:Uncharacterized protein n=1 Tax=Ceratodon purpureus TaxID=3225 RepID=A0A8T0H485_CERPU|nr:hypothetical protein KC19_7G091100 [Ceratodon purpureus]
MSPCLSSAASSHSSSTESSSLTKPSIIPRLQSAARAAPTPPLNITPTISANAAHNYTHSNKPYPAHRTLTQRIQI